MSLADEIRGVTLRLIDLLESERLPYAFMGGIVVPVWGIPRATYDVDLTVSAEASGVERLLRVAKQRGFHIDHAFEVGFRDKLGGMDKLTMEWWTEGSRRVEVDVFLVTTEYQRVAFGRRVSVKIDGREMWVVRAADLILHKLAAGRPKDLADVQNVLAVQGLVEEPYLREWSARLKITERLETALAQAGLK